MSTLADDLQQLLRVQEVDTLIGRAKSDQAALDTGAKIAASYNTGKAEFDTLRADAMRAQATQSDAEMRLSSIETKKKEVNGKLYGGKVTASRELENLQKEIEMLDRQKGEAEEAVLLAMDAASDALGKATSAEATLASQAERYKQIRALYKKEMARLDAEIARHEAERATLALPVPPALLARYDAIRARRNNLGATPLQADGSCGACHTQLSAHLVQDVRAAQTPQTCEHCGRLLIPPAS